MRRLRSCELGAHRVPLGSALVGMGEGEDGGLGEGSAADLEADRQPGAGEAAGHSDSRKTEDVERRRVADAEWIEGLAFGESFGRAAHGGCDEEIEVREDADDVPASEIGLAKRVGVGGRWMRRCLSR